MNRILLVITIALVQACAFTDATLDVAHDPEASFSGPIDQLDSIEFLVPELLDNRVDKERIGWKKNGYGQNTADIMTSQPVEVIVSNALTSGLTSNGHQVIDDGRVAITGTVNRFWFEMDINFWTVEFIGDVQCTINFVDKATSATIYTSDYAGSYSEKKGGGLNKTWQTIMSKAVDVLVEDMVYDEDLVEALEKYSTEY